MDVGEDQYQDQPQFQLFIIKKVWMSDINSFQVVEPRASVEVHLPNGLVVSGPRNSPVGSFLHSAHPDPEIPIVGAVVNYELRELTYPIQMDSRVRPITMGEADGMRIYRRSLTFLLEAAFESSLKKEYPTASLTIDHSVASGGYYCQVRGHLGFTKADLQRLEERMHTLVQADLPLKRQEVPLDTAIAYFASHDAADKVKLLSQRQKSYLTLYSLGEYHDYHHGYMVPSTGYLRWFALEPADGGFTLRFPRRHAPTRLLPLPNYPRLLRAFRQYGDWLEHLGISSVGELNEEISKGRQAEVILLSEAFHELQVADIASQIAQKRDQVRLVLISGPSSSGKTTFSKRLTVQLLALGLAPFPLEMDNYFLDRQATPRDVNGDYDFESMRAMNIGRLEQDLQGLVAGEMTQLPRFNFRAGVSEPGDWIQLRPQDLIILEGIHGLNPQLIPDFPVESTFRVYVSCLTQLNLDRHNRISTTDTRLIRRIVRDASERGYSARQTLQRWESVRRGEKENIFPFQENADAMFNSALAYELSVLKTIAEPLLRQVPYGAEEYIEAKRLLAFLAWFLPLESDLIPDNSILREFTGRSILREFRLWRRPVKE